MTDEELLEYTSEFRKGILDGRSSRLMCFAVCAPLVTLLEMNGIRCELVEVDAPECNHCFIQLGDGRVLDPTADQFGGELPAVYLGEPLDIHEPPDGGDPKPVN